MSLSQAPETSSTDGEENEKVDLPDNGEAIKKHQQKANRSTEVRSAHVQIEAVEAEEATNDLEDALNKMPDKFTEEDLTEEQREIYADLDPRMQPFYLKSLAKQAKRESEKQKGTRKTKLSLEFGKETFVEAEPVLHEVLPQILERAEDLRNIVALITQEENAEEVSERVWGQVDAVFDKLPDSDELKQWNRKQAAKGRYAHLAAYLMQDFRNSPEAETLSELYKDLSKEGRIALETKLEGEVNDHFTFELMFKVGMRPYVFPPEQSPTNTTFVSGRDKHLDVRDQNDRKVFGGSEEFFDGEYEYEGNNASMYNSNGKISFLGQYYINSQPAFRFFNYDENGNKTRDLFFKTYLGDKAMCLLYHDQEEIESIPISEEQMFALRNFFRWDRGEKGEEAIRQYEDIWSKRKDEDKEE